VSGHSLKLHFCMFKRSKGKHNSLNCYKKNLEYFPFVTKFTCSKFDMNQKCFFMFKTLKLVKWTILIFSNIFFSTKCAAFLLKIEEDFIIDD